MDIQTSFRTCIEKYADFTGRAQRSELWWFFLATTLLTFVLTLVDVAVFSGLAAEIGVFSSLFSLAVLLPSIAVTVRRLHDIDRTGWWALLILLPIVGWIATTVIGMGICRGSTAIIVTKKKGAAMGALVIYASGSAPYWLSPSVPFSTLK